MRILSKLIEPALWLLLVLGYLMGIVYIVQGLKVTLSAEEKKALAEVGLMWIYGTTGFVAALALCGVWILKKSH